MRSFKSWRNRDQGPTQSAKHFETLKDTGFWGKRGAGVLVFEEKTKTFLLLKRSLNVEQPGKWGIPGGAIDDVELDSKEAAHRELQEETGFTHIDDLKLLYVFEKGEFKFYNYLAIIDSPFTPQLDWENSDFKWVTLDQMVTNRSYLHFGVNSIIDNKFEYLDSLID
jgi:8-oxo-dGTP pyrophosphatase MutT (NUDIX family)